MVLKSRIISFVAIILLFASSSVYSRGPWETKNNSTSNNGIWNSSASDGHSIGNILRDPPPDGGGPGDQPPGNTGTTPVGEGLAILSLLSGGYFILKGRNSKKIREV